MASFNSTVLARVAAALYDVQLGNETMDWALEQVNFLGGLNAVANSVYNTDFSTKSNAEMATLIVKNLGVTGTAVAAGEAAVLQELNNAPAGQKGAVVVAIVNVYSTLTAHPDFGGFAKAFNQQISAAVDYAATADTTDVPVHPEFFFNVTETTAAGADVARLTGDLTSRWDFSNPAHQVKGLDLDGSGRIDANAKENNPAYLEVNNAVVAASHSGFEIVDAYARNPLDHSDAANNYLGDLLFDGTGFAGDGVNTDGNIVLGGLGADQIFGGIGNDFLAGGGVNQDAFDAGRRDFLQGGRNADFAFVELSAIDQTDGAGLRYDGGETADNVPGTQNILVDRAGTANDRDWVLLEASDDDEAVNVTLTDADPGITEITTRSGGSGGTQLAGVEAIDASGNLYGFLNDLDVQVGGRSTDLRSVAPVAGTENYGLGSTGQIIVAGSDSANIVVAGYDQDTVNAAGGNDVIYGGNLGYLITNKNNPNLLDDKGGLDLNVNGAGVVSDGTDILNGQDDNDAIVYEAASGRIDGGNHFDTLYVTDYSVGRVKGAVAASDNSADQVAALKALSGDQVVRLDLANAAGGAYRDYGGANRGFGVNATELPTGDQTNYVSALGATPAATVRGVEAVITTGLGVIDYKAAGSNSPELTFNNQQNYQGSVAKFDVRGVDSDGLSTTKFGNYWTDANFGVATDGTRLTNIDANNGGGSGSANAAGATGIAFRDAGDNAIYLSAAGDNLEGRLGDDELGGGRGDDNFFFDFGDGTDIVRRQSDKDSNNLWDTDAAGNLLYVQDFRADPTGVAASLLKIDFGGTVIDGTSTVVSEIRITLNPGTATASKLTVTGLETNKSLADVATAVTQAFQKIDPAVTVTVNGNALLVQDTKGRDISDTASEGYFVFGSVSNSTLQSTATLNPGGQTLQENDRVLFVDYQARTSNTWVDNTINELRNQAQDILVGTGSTTTLAEGQQWRVQFQNLQPGDKVDLQINGTHFVRTVKDTENTDSFLTAFANQLTNETLDLFTSAGDISASTADVVTVPANSADERVLVIVQDAIGTGNNRVYMNAPTVTITAANSSTSSASWAVANTSSTSIELLGYASGNGNLNADNVLFLGRSGQATLATKDSTSILQTAKDVGETLTGKDATVVAIPATPVNIGNNAGGLYEANNGDDQLIGGPGNDTLSGGTGDDRFIGSWGTDTVTGGGSATAPNGEVIRFRDSLVFQENDFGAGTTFTVAPSANLDDRGKGTVTAALGTKTGVTTFDGIEELRTASNAAQDVLDFSGLSNSVATSTGASANRDKAAITSAAATGDDLNDGVLVRLTATNAGIYWATDRNSDDDTKDSGEVGSNPLAIFGVENVIGGNANDHVVLDQTQAGSKNSVSLGGQQEDTTTTGTFLEGADRVTVDHAGVTSDLRPTLTVKIESGANVDTVTSTAGVLGTASIVDTLTGVEELDFATGATSEGPQTNPALNDVIDLSALTNGATLNFSAVGITVGKTLGGAGTPASLAVNEANTFEAGGVSVTGTGLGNEVAEITGTAQFEKVVGSAGTDRVIVGGPIEGGNDNNGSGNLFSTGERNYNFFEQYDNATRGYTNSATSDNIALYTFDLGAGTNDSLDYRTGTFGVAVTVDFGDGTFGDTISVDSNNNSAFDNRVDVALNVERFFGAGGTFDAAQNLTAGRGNIIDLSGASEATTVTFGYESSVSLNEFKDPNGTATSTVDSVTGIRVGNATTPTAALFMQASALNGRPQAFWTEIQGTDFADTVNFSAFQDRNWNETLVLRGGANVVDYTAGVLAGKSDAYALAVSDFTVVKDATSTHGGYTVSHSSTDDAVADVDKISITRQYSAAGDAIDGGLTVIASSNSNDTVTIAALGAPTAATGVVGTKFGSTTAVNENTLWTDISGNVGGGHNRVDLGTGAGVTTGTVIQDVKQTIVGGESDGNNPASAPVFYDNVVTSIKAFERITGSNFSDRLFGNDSDNVIDGGTGNDIVQGRGGADTITLGTGTDRLVYVGAGDTGHINTPTLTNLTATGFDSIVDFDTDPDFLVIDKAAGWSSLLGNTVASGTVAATSFATGGPIGTILFTDDNLITSANATNMTAVVAGLGAAATVTGAGVPIGTQTIFAVDATDRVGIYVWTASTANDTTIGANEVQLLSILDDDDIAAADTAQALSLSDIAMRFSAQAGQQLNQALVAGVREEIAYSSLAQSQYGAIDSFGSFTAGGVLQFNFVAGEDKLDLSGFGLAANGALAINAVIVRDRTGASNQITDANANDFFIDGGTVRRTVVVEFDNDDIDGGTAGVQARARIFVDVNGDGQLSTTQDLFIDFATAGLVATGTIATGVGNGGVPGFGDIIWGV